MSPVPNALLPPIESRTTFKVLHRFLFPCVKASIGESCSTKTTGRPDFELIEHVGSDRAAVETFISQCFSDNFGCRIEGFMPRLFSVRNRDGEMYGAFGLRSANHNLFLEQYLDMPIEKTIATRIGKRVERRTIIEVGHFSGAFPGAVRAMIGLLTERLHREGFEWVVFTGTTNLRNAFFRLGLSPVDVQAATLERLPAEERAAWGSYYDHAPHVLVGNIQEGYQAMQFHPTPDRIEAEAVA